MTLLSDERLMSSAAWTRIDDKESITITLRSWPGSGPAVLSAGKARNASYRPFDKQLAPWLSDALDRIRVLMAERGATFSKEAIMAAVRLLADPTWYGAPPPLIGPRDDDSGISIEFRGESTEMQIEFNADGVGEAYVCFGNELEWDGALEDLPDGIDKWAWRLTQSRI